MANKHLSYAIFFSFSLFVSCNYSEDEINSGDVIVSLEHTPTTIPADGVSKALITVQLPDNTMETKRAIILNTTKGVFEIENKNTITVNAANVLEDGTIKVKGIASVISNTEEGFTVIKATVGNYIKTDTIYFTRSYPQNIDILTDRINYLPTATSEVTVTVQVSRNPGYGSISLGQQLFSLEARDDSGDSVGQWRNKTFLLDSSGKCLNYFSLPVDSPFLGTVHFTAVVYDSETSIKSDTTNINVID